MTRAIQFSVTRTGVDEFKIIVQSDQSILRTVQTSYAGARASVLQELLDLEVLELAARPACVR